MKMVKFIWARNKSRCDYYTTRSSCNKQLFSRYYNYSCSFVVNDVNINIKYNFITEKNYHFGASKRYYYEN